MTEVVVNKKSFAIFSDNQEGNDTKFCRNLDLVSGRCNIHEKRPLACDFEVIKFLHPYNSGHYTLTSRLFGRSWKMTQIDGSRGIKCEMIPANDYWKGEVLRRLKRLEGWANYLEVGPTYLDEVIPWVESGPHNKPLWIGKNTE